MAKITFLPTNQEIEISPEKTLLQGALEQNILIRSICKGKMNCVECRIKIVAGENNVVPPSKAEKNVIGTSYHIDGRRLACQVRCFGPVTVDLSEQISREENSKKKIRGFKTEKSQESTAVMDTMLLSNKPKA